MMDQNKPARFLDTAYNALKANPNATNQILQAAAKGAPVGLRGLAAAAAQQNQQEAQKAMAAQQAQGPQQSIIQKLAGASGIMGQLPSSLQLASAPTGPAPEEMPQQMMATGGLVSFADGGNVLPPDVIDAIQSHFAYGGEVRGFYEGDYVDAAPHLIPSSWAEAVKEMLSPAPGRGRDVIAAEQAAKEDKARRTPPSGILTALQNMMSPSPGNRPAVKEITETPTETTGALDYDLSKVAPPKESGVEKAVRTSFENPEKSTWQPEPHDGHDVTPRQRVIEEGTKVDKKFEEAKKDVPSAAVTPVSEQLGGLEALGGLSGLGNLEQMRDLMADLRGHKTLDPETSKQLAELKSDARTSTILQSALGAIGAGLTNPYGGRYALGHAALGALSGYQKGIGSEEEIGRKAFDVLRGYADAPAEEQAKAADAVMSQLKNAAELQSARDIAEAKGDIGMEKAILQGINAQRRTETMYGGQQSRLEQTNKKLAEDEFNNWYENKLKAQRQDYTRTPITQQEMDAQRARFYEKYGVEHLLGGLGSSRSQVQSGGLGGQQPGIFITRN